MAHFRINLMGSFSVFCGDGRDCTPSGKNARAILAMLALAKNGRRSRSWLQDHLWSEKPHAKGRASLRQELTNLRKHFETFSSCLIFTSGDDVVLDKSIVSIDANEAALPSHIELLEGFEHDDAVFEEWLSDERAYFYEKLDRGIPDVDEGLERVTPSEVTSRFVPRIQVEDFEYIGKHVDLEDFVAGLAQELRTVVGSIAGTYEILGSEDVDSVAVDYVLRGAVRFDQFFRVNAYIFEKTSGKQIWSGRFNTRGADLFLEQENVSKEIADGLLEALSDGAWSGYWMNSQTTTEVWELFQKGRVQEHQAQRYSLRKAIDFYRAAIEKDVAFLPAHISLAFCLIDCARLCFIRESSEIEAEISNLVCDLYERYPENSHVQALTAFLNVYQGRFSEALLTMERVCELSPRSPEMLSYYGAILGYCGDYRKEQKIYQHALMLTPHPPVWISTNLAFSLLLSGDACDEIELSEIHAQTGGYQRALVANIVSLVRSDRLSEAQRCSEKLLALDPEFVSDEWRSIRFFSNSNDHKLIAEVLRRAGLP